MPSHHHGRCEGTEVIRGTSSTRFIAVSERVP